MPIGCRGAADPIGWLATARAVGVTLGSITFGPIVAGNKSVAVGRGVRVGVVVRVGPKSGNGRTVAVGAIGRGVAVGAAQADSALANINTLKNIRINTPRVRVINTPELYRTLRQVRP